MGRNCRRVQVELPERVVNFDLRSRWGGFDFGRRHGIVEHNKQQKRPRPGGGRYNFLDLRKLSYGEKRKQECYGDGGGR